MTPIILTIIHLLLNVAICYNLRKTCPAIPVKTRLPFQCETVTNTNIPASCDENGNYPYLFSCQTDDQGTVPIQTLTSHRFNNTCTIQPGEIWASAMCCNQVIKQWNFEYNNIDCITKLPDNNIHITGCYGDSQIDYETKTCITAPDTTPVAQCHQVPSNQELQCTILESDSQLDIPCPNKTTMIWCDKGVVLFNDNPLGLCSDPYNVAECCAIYKSETYPIFASYKYLVSNDIVVPSQADNYCLSHFETHAASIHTQHDFLQADALCNNISDNKTLCCLGASDENIEGVWKWYDGTGTLPPGLKWNNGGLWYNNESNTEGHYTCMIGSDDYPYGILGCDPEGNDNSRCYPICNAAGDNTVVQPEGRRRLQRDSFMDTCFEIEITLNVENILPDPTYILPETNNNAIKKVLEQMLIDNNINEYNIDVIMTYNNELYERRRMIDNSLSVENECPFEEDNSINRFYFNLIPYNISCDNETLNSNTNIDRSVTLQWEFSTHNSIVYIWNIQKVITSIEISCPGVDMEIYITDINNTLIIGQSDRMSFVYWDYPYISIQEFTFISAAEPVILNSNTTYILNININPHSFQDCHDSLDIFTVELTPLILAIAEPSSCKLGSILAIDESIKFGLGSFCNDNASETRISFEQMLYKNHASDQIIAKEKWNTLPITNDNNNIRRLLVDDFEEDDSGTNGSSLHIVWTNGKSIQIANDSIFPYYDQCIAVDDDTLRVFSVGGQINGQAINRLSVHEIISKTNAKLSEDIKYINLTLDRPRYATMCYFYRNKFDNNKEYIIVINGMNNINEINNNSNWYNDIVFIPLNENERNNRIFPKIKLKYNVIDMRPFVTETNELYLFGGRNSLNATNYIQVIDLNYIFNNSFNNNNNNILETYDRMEHMRTYRIIPFVDFPKLRNESCIMVIGGQDYINGQYIDTQVPLIGLQLYCNQELVAYLENTRRRRLQNDNENEIEFTEFDYNNLQQMNNESILNDNNLTIVINEYNFTNDNILYEFTVSFEICFNNGLYYKNTLNLLNNIKNNSQKFAKNILKESQKNYRGWSFGFGDVNVLDMNIITFNKTISPTIEPTNEPSILPTIKKKTMSPIINNITTTNNIIIISQTNTPTKAPTESEPKKLSTLMLILIIVGSVIGVIIIGVIIFLIIRKVKNDRNDFERLPNDTDDETEMEEL